MTVVVDQTQPADGIPSFAKKFVGEQIQIVQREAWKDASSATLVVEIPGKPATSRAASTSPATPTGRLRPCAGDIKVKIPMLGGKLEGLIGDLLKKALKSEQRVGRAWLAGDR